MKFIAHWYDQDSEKGTDGPFEAKDKAEAERIAYTRKNGSPPAPMLYLEEVSE